MENKVSNGIQTLAKFAKEIPEGSSNFDYFALLDHISKNKMDRDLIAAIFCERNKPFEESEKCKDNHIKNK